MVYAVCPECLRMVEEATPEERRAIADLCDLALLGERPN
jgi:hypothetical protein